MLDIFIILFYMFAYSNLCIVLVGLSSKRRNAGKPAYWLLLIVAIALEIGIVILILSVAEFFSLMDLGFMSAPFLGAALAGYFYWRLAEIRDESADNQ